MSAPADLLTPADIQARLAARRAAPYVFPARDRFHSGEPLPAAVLIPLLRNRARWELLFIRRTTVDGDSHSGQVAFPGGRAGPEDASIEQTALREAKEEVGLSAGEVQVLGAMEHTVTISNYHLTPVVGVITWPFEIVPHPMEVERVFTIPLAWLADPANHQIRQRPSPGGGSHPVIYFENYDGELLWGVTAQITLNFLNALDLL
ncbi:MAG: CoA pyrophosphatase [Chloroflexi bacterium]|nr:CoA pyrophosphatase [Chloroflexota bacterium]